MKELEITYEQRIRELDRQAKKNQKQLFGSGVSRLALFGGAAAMAYLAFGQSAWYGVPALALLALFAFLVARHQDLKYQSRRLQELLRINRTELQVLSGQFSDLPDGAEYRDAAHPFSEDLDLFGQGSFFQYLNRTGMAPGAEMLAGGLCANQPGGVAGRQEAVRELSPQLDWRQEFLCTARLLQVPVTPGELYSWLEQYEPQLPEWARYFPAIFSLGSLGTALLVALGLLPPGFLAGVFFAGLLITLPFSKRLGRLASDTGKVQETFSQYQRLVQLVEGHSFRSANLLAAKGALLSEGKPVSARLKEFSRLISALDQRNNLLVALAGNGFFLWELRQGVAVETWIRENGRDVRAWFTALARFDAQVCLANFAYNHPGFAYPEIHPGTHRLRAEGLAHPLLQEGAVRNDLSIENGHLFVITGANMAGKSTFLRAVGLSLVMANTGLPVAARKYAYHPAPLLSSMRTSDSLSRQESYFFAELKRLKMIVDQIRKEPCFVVLDEILKGTNSRDKAEGSRKFLERLSALGATGLIATHDLSLCEVAGHLPGVHNHYFDAEVRHGELYFDYRLQPGVSTNMNASFLLRKMGVVEE
jgi:hypothetical protein